jgi:dynein light chain Tctex-type 1
MKQKLLHERWNAKKVEVWSKDIIEATLKRLAEAKAAYKYVVTCAIMQRTGAGLTAAFATRWDQSRDAFVSVPFESEHLHCIVTVYWIKLE